MIKSNRIREKLRAGEPVIGCQIRTLNPMIAEVYGACGFDYVFIDGEHFPCQPVQVLDLVRGCELGGLEPVLRIVDHDPGKILQYFDMGVTGMIFPHCDTGEQAHALVEAGKYAPVGKRGFSNTSRATGYGTLPMKEYKCIANENCMLWPMVESKEAVENIDDIIASGIDVLKLGPGDLSDSYGVEISDPIVQNAIDYVIEKANAAGIPVGAPAATVEESVAYIRRGVKLISFSSDLMLLRGVGTRSLKEIREALGQKG